MTKESRELVVGVEGDAEDHALFTEASWHTLLAAMRQ